MEVDMDDDREEKTRCTNCSSRLTLKAMQNGATLCWDCFYCACKRNNTLHVAHYYWRSPGVGADAKQS